MHIQHVNFHTHFRENNNYRSNHTKYIENW